MFLMFCLEASQEIGIGIWRIPVVNTQLVIDQQTFIWVDNDLKQFPFFFLIDIFCCFKVFTIKY